MDALNAYTYGSFVWLGIQAIPLIIWPTFISSMLTPDYQHGNVVEEYFARSLGFSQLAVGLLVLVLSGALPLTSLADADPAATSPYADAAVLVSMLHHAAGAFYQWARYSSSGQTGYLLGFVGSSALAAAGLWVLMFAAGAPGATGRVSRRTGADKRTSGWPFRNAEADKKKKGKGRKGREGEEGEGEEIEMKTL